MMNLKRFHILLLISLGVLFYSPVIFAATINVPADYSVIQSALNVSVSGDTVVVSSGTYKENITIPSGVILKGSGCEVTIIEGSPGVDTVVMASSSQIRDFSIINSNPNSKGIKLTGSGSVINNIISGYANGVYTAGYHSQPLIEGNIFYDNTTGICVLSHTMALIRNNTIINNYRGITTGDSESIITNNIIVYNNRGIYQSSNNVVVILNPYNNVYGNTYNYENVTPGEGTISLEPMFVNVGLRDYKLMPGSPCINAGNPDPQYNDVDGSRNDMGAYGGVNAMPQPGTEVPGPGITINVPEDYLTIQEGINAASAGDTVVVAAGTYTGNIVIKSGIMLQGNGYSDTIIDGAGIGNVVIMENGTEIRGFSIINGGIGDFSGIRCSGRVVIKDNNIHASSDNGIYGESMGDSQIINNIIHEYAIRGINTSLSSPVIDGNIIHSVGMFSTWYGIVTMTDSLTPCSPIIRNNTIMYNQGPAINTYNTTAIVENNILMYNQSAIYRPASYSSKTVVNTYNNAYDNWDTNYVNITPGEGAISVDPLFIDLYGQNFSLQAGSPCINTGNPAPEYNDRDGSRNDMGAYGGPNGMQAEADITPPFTTGHAPAKNEINVSKSTNIKVSIKDDYQGVDLSTVHVSVGGQIVYDGSAPGNYLDTTVTGDRKEYVLNYDSPEDFSYNQIINVSISASDLIGNVMPQEEYLFTISPSPEKTAIWHKENVDLALTMCLGTSMAVDSNNKAHISYFDFMTSGVNYATNINGYWDIINLDINIDPNNGSAIAVDAQDRIHIVYSCMDEMGGQYVKYALKESPEAPWDIKIIDGPTALIGMPSIAVDSKGKAHVSYTDVVMESLKYATNSSGSWVVSSIDTGIGPCYYSAAAVDSNDKVHIVYITVTKGTIHANNISGQWDYESIDNSELDTVSLAMDSENKIHLSGNNAANKEVGYMTNVSGSWVYTPVDNYTSTWLDTRIAVDSQGKAHIAYREGEVDFSSLKYATNIEGFWNKMLLEDGGEAPAIAVDSSDNVQISYFNGFVEPVGLKYAYGIYNVAGDVNQDNQIDVLDVQCLVNHILGFQDWADKADVNKDFSVDAIDIQLIVNYILGV